MTTDEAQSLRDAARAGDDIAAALPALVAACDGEGTHARLREAATEAIRWHFVHRRAWRELGEIIEPRRSHGSFYYRLASIARTGCEVAPAFEHVLRAATDYGEVNGLIATAREDRREAPRSRHHAHESVSEGAALRHW